MFITHKKGNNMKFKDYLNEQNKYKTKGSAEKAIKRVISNTVELLAPEAFEIEHKNTDAGMGGYNYIQIIPRSTRNKDMNDIENVKNALEELVKKDMDEMKFTYNPKNHIMIIEPKDSVNEDVTGNEIDSLVDNFLTGVQKVVELSITMFENEIKENPTLGMNKALDYVLKQYKKNKSPLSDDFLVVAIKTALFRSLKEQGYEDETFKKNILKDLKKIK